MDVTYPCCAGLDVHKETVAGCALWVDPHGKRQKEIATFGTTTRQLLALADWLSQRKITHVAMESTGVYWKPIFNILEGTFTVLLVNARHIKQVPGRKTDIKDCEWIGDLLQHGLLKASFVPDRPQRDLRDLTRHRAQLVGEQTRVINRMQKILEDANIKLASVASNALGVSGRAMIQSLIRDDQTPEQMADLARGKLRRKTAQLGEALQGHVTEHHRFMLIELWGHLEYLEKAIAKFESRIEERTRPFAQEIARLDEIPGVDRITAQAILAEIGNDMSRFPTADHLASWAGVCPGNNESAGKRKSGKTTPGNRWLQRCLSQAAWASSHTKDTYLSAQFRQIARRRGKKRAIIAVARTILISAYYLLRDAVPYEELGGDYFDRINPERIRQYHVRRLQKLGFVVTLQEAAPAA